jgi:uncharacterized protein YlaN (UPF0358 family)
MLVYKFSLIADDRLQLDNNNAANIMMKREEASKFLKRVRRDLNNECYGKCCTWEEVREHYEFDIAAAVRFILPAFGYE